MLVVPPPEHDTLHVSPEGHSELEPPELPEPLDPDPPLPDDDVLSPAPASLPWLFEPELLHPATEPTRTVPRPASTARARRDTNGFPTSPAHRRRARLSSDGTVAAACGHTADADYGYDSPKGPS